MKSFIQYISEVVTEKPKGIEFEHEKLPLGIGTGNHVNNYHIKHPNGRNYKVTMHTRTEDGYKMSTVNFADTEGRTHRTGRMANPKDKHSTGVGKASQVLSQVNHVIKHHVKDESPDKLMFVSDRSIYHKMGKRSADKLGYRHADIDPKGVTQHYVKKKKK